ncbi:MAG: type II toxin-antitoxin system VapC family toxin [Deltaproteobacteria bacterium]|nr:type II toxin-antitoxin system VapC family toxin [Deltaproteobacteria bacterium]
MPPALLFCDTSFFFASLVPADPNHFKAKEALDVYKTARLTTTWDIIGETVTLLRYRGNYNLAVQFLDKVRPHLELVSYDASVREETVKVFRKHASDKRLSFCDCLSFVILSIFLEDVPVLTFDRDFKQFGFSLAC